MARKRALYVSLSILALFLTGTVIVLSSVTYYLAIDPSLYLSDLEVPILDSTTRWNASDHGQVERIPRIIHQTWKSETLPEKWKEVSQGCRDMMPDYEYMLWTDEGSRDFIAEHYPWFLDTFDAYPYVIQRADAIRYFVLHKYGGIYIDLDIGCLRPMDPLLVYPVILPKTIPVGVSNDLMFAEQGHPFMEQTIHNLVTFDHSWVLNYPTVMFSTGPMFLSAQYGIYTSSHPSGQVRILPKSLYGKNAKEGEAPHSFFSHYYGSSWHADDAAFIAFLGMWGKALMWIGLVILVIGLIKLALPGSKQRKYSLRRIGGYDVLLPRWTQRSGRWYLDLGLFSLPASATSTQQNSPNLSLSQSPVDGPILHLPFDVPSPSPSDISSAESSPNSISDAVRRLRNRISHMTGVREEPPRTPIRPRRPRSRGFLFFVPAIFRESSDVELMHTVGSQDPEAAAPLLNPSVSRSVSRTASPPRWPPEKQRYAADFERAGLDVEESLPQYSQHTPDTSILVDHHDTHLRPTSRSASRNASRVRDS
ncbi:hypothetical protein BDN71DRAFT_877576 [Pleurotus eryngii]|uniref:Glycosyltransferase family 32 protein n=1 Tax=Pleurotus eryngii TaxID=5323 RepID=A0A9P6DGQ3_PLEER|nr:hypothetical protein BDN71DRAFT_877576 [Pleurotus eryngii]